MRLEGGIERSPSSMSSVQLSFIFRKKTQTFLSCVSARSNHVYGDEWNTRQMVKIPRRYTLSGDSQCKYLLLNLARTGRYPT